MTQPNNNEIEHNKYECDTCQDAMREVPISSKDNENKLGDWEKDVEEMFVVGNMRFAGLTNNKLTPENLKSFIRNLLHQRDEEIKKLKKENNLWQSAYLTCDEETKQKIRNVEIAVLQSHSITNKG